MAKEIQPLGERVVVLPIQAQETTKGGIILPDTVKEKPQEGKVLAVGPGRYNDQGTRNKPDVKVGDIVLYPKYGGTEYKLEDEELMILRESDILGIITTTAAAKKK